MIEIIAAIIIEALTCQSIRRQPPVADFVDVLFIIEKLSGKATG
ncbi:hypothetical protein ACQRBN_01985 [Bariatricus sp. SGI.154]